MSECEIQRDRTWSGQYYCGAHGVWFRNIENDPSCCPAGEVAVDRDEWMQQHENLLHMYEQVTADLAALKETFIEVNIARCNANADVAALEARLAAAVDALEAAARSLETLSRAGGRGEEIKDLIDVRGYASSRASAAWAAREVA